MHRLRTLLVCTALAACTAASATAPSATTATGSGVWTLSRCGVTWIGNETAKVQACLDSVRVNGGELNFEGRCITQYAPLALHASPTWIGQLRGVVLTNNLCGVTLSGDFPFLTVDAGLTVYKATITRMHILAPSRAGGGAVIPFDQFSSSTFSDNWIFTTSAAICFKASTSSGAAPYYNTFANNILGCGTAGVSITADPTTHLGGNTNTFSGNRFTAPSAVCLEIGRYVQNITVGEGNAFESCGLGMRLDGTRLSVSDNQRMENCTATAGVCIQLGPYSDGMIGRLYWSAYTGPRIRADVSLDLADWTLASQPPNP